MSFLMDFIDQPVGGDSLLERNYNNADGIELRDYNQQDLVVEEVTGPRLHRDRRGRMIAIAASLMLVVVVLTASHHGKNDSNSTPAYMSPVSTAQMGANAMTTGKPKPTVATSHSFTKPNITQASSRENAFLPSYSLQEIVQRPFSPQGKALQWLENYPHFRAIRQWRKRQLMALATFYYSTGGDTHWFSEAKTDWMSNTIHECNWKGDVLFNPSCSKKGYKGRYQKMELGFGTLKGTIPPELSMLTDLKYLELYGNDELKGTIPTQFGRFSSMTDLSLYSNKLEGPLPSQLGRLTKLTVMNLDHNQLTGSIPSELGLMKSIQRLHLSDNQLTGEVPSVLKQLSNLRSLYLQGNNLNGTVSPSMCYFQDLQEIWVDCESVKCPCAECMCAETSVPIDDYLEDKQTLADTESQKKAKKDSEETLQKEEGISKYQPPPKYPSPNDP